MGECAECKKRREAQVALPVVVSNGLCPMCHGIRGAGIRPVGDRTYQCLDPHCAFRWSECIGCGS